MPKLFLDPKVLGIYVFPYKVFILQGNGAHRSSDDNHDTSQASRGKSTSPTSMNSGRSRSSRVSGGGRVSDLRGRRSSRGQRDNGRASGCSGDHAATTVSLSGGLFTRLASQGSLGGGGGLRDGGGSSGQFAVRTPTGHVAGSQSRGAGVERATGLGGLGRSTTATAVNKVADLASVGNPPNHTGFVPLIGGLRRDAATDVGAGSREAGKPENDGEGKGLHFCEYYGTNEYC